LTQGPLLDERCSFVRHDIPSGFRRIALDNQKVVDTKLSKDHGRQRE
jgi:hypothetical protein